MAYLEGDDEGMVQ